MKRTFYFFLIHTCFVYSLKYYEICFGLLVHNLNFVQLKLRFGSLSGVLSRALSNSSGPACATSSSMSDEGFSRIPEAWFRTDYTRPPGRQVSFCRYESGRKDLFLSNNIGRKVHSGHTTTQSRSGKTRGVENVEKTSKFEKRYARCFS